MAELSPQAIREVRFREKLRGYNPEDVDTFVADVAATVEALTRRLQELQTAAPGAPSAEGAAPGVEPGAVAADDRSAAISDIEDQLRRTLVLAQRTADMAVQEAQQEANRLVAEAQAEREQLIAEIGDLRSRQMAEVEAELADERNRLFAERDALRRDVAALQAYVAQERERLRIYFSEQLRRVEEGVPGTEVAPTSEAADAPEAPAAAVVVDEPGLPETEVEAVAPEAGGTATVDAEEDDGNDDPFLAELRRAVTDTEPLGPRDHEPPAEDSGRPVDIFDDEDGGGRFLRRRR